MENHTDAGARKERLALSPREVVLLEVLVILVILLCILLVWNWHFAGGA